MKKYASKCVFDLQPNLNDFYFFAGGCLACDFILFCFIFLQTVTYMMNHEQAEEFRKLLYVLVKCSCV